MPKPDHLILKRLLDLWELDADEAGHSGLGRLSARDLDYFNRVFKDSLVARGGSGGPFRLSFVGTSLEAHLGRQMINVEVGDCFGRSAAQPIGAGLVESVRRRRPLHAELALSSANRPDRLKAELLCLPFAETIGPGTHPIEDTTTIFGTLAVAGLEELPPEPTHHQMSILTISIL
jgi:hypothetical protein